MAFGDQKRSVGSKIPEGRRHLTVYRHDVSDLCDAARPMPSDVPVNYEVLRWTLPVCRYIAKSYLMGSVLNRERVFVETADPRDFRRFLAGLPWTVRKPLGSRDFEGWAAMLMLSLGRPDSHPLARRWEREMRAIDEAE